MAAAIPANFGSGGANLTPAGNGKPSLAEALRSGVDDTAAIIAACAGVVDAALPAFTDPPSAAEMAALRSLVNQQRAALVAIAAVVQTLTKA